MKQYELKRAADMLRYTPIAFGISIISLLLVLPAFKLMDTGKYFLAYMTSAIFWIGIIGGLVSVVLTDRFFRVFRAKLPENSDLPNLPGIINFRRRNKPLYIFIAVLAVIVIMDMLLEFVPQALAMLLLIIDLFGVLLHSVIDGKNYLTYTSAKYFSNKEGKKR